MLFGKNHLDPTFECAYKFFVHFVVAIVISYVHLCMLKINVTILRSATKVISDYLCSLSSAPVCFPSFPPDALK